MATINPLLFITMPDDDGEDRHFAPIILILQAMISVNKWHIQRAMTRAQNGKGNPIPPLYASGVRYKEDPPGEENWKDCLAIMKDGHGDCDRLAAWRVAELNVSGTPAEPVIKWQQIPKNVMVNLGHPSHMVPSDGVSMVHVLVRVPNSQCPEHARRNPSGGCTCTIEDPSKILGMGGNFTNGV